MSTKIYAKARFGFRSDTLSNWQAKNPILEKGEPAIVTDGVDGEWLKIGDGVTAFNDLEWKKGPKGDKGDKGAQGEKGDRGVQGVQGLRGPQGERGPQGAKGDTGEKGDTGAIGPQGPKGDVGAMGPQGEKGEKGDTGESGKDAVTDQTYNPESSNAQSGKAVAEALTEYAQSNEFEGSVVHAVSKNGYATTEQVSAMFDVLPQNDITENIPPQLETNKVYRFNIISDVIFNLPTDVDNAVLNSIELQVTISNYETISIDLGATKYFGDIPELNNGSYIIYYEHNGEDWCVGALEIVGA